MAIGPNGGVRRQRRAPGDSLGRGTAERGADMAAPLRRRAVSVFEIWRHHMLLEIFPHTIRVHLATHTMDTYENEIVVPAVESIEVPCRLQQQSTTNDRAGSRVSRQYKVLAAFDAQLTELSRAEFDGSTFIVSNVIRRDDSPSTRHCTALLREEA